MHFTTIRIIRSYGRPSVKGPPLGESRLNRSLRMARRIRRMAICLMAFLAVSMFLLSFVLIPRDPGNILLWASLIVQATVFWYNARSLFRDVKMERDAESLLRYLRQQEDRSRRQWGGWET